MNPQKMFCSNPDCPAKGQVGKGNIIIHSKKKQSYKCKVCGKTFTKSKGAVHYRRKIPEEILVYEESCQPALKHLRGVNK